MGYDVFLSYARADGERARAIRDALAARGLAVWFDQTEIEDFTSITRSITHGLSQSKALLALYSVTYPTRRACQWELTAAFLAATRREELGQRVLVVNPEKGARHIEPVELRDALYRAAPQPEDQEALCDLADSVAAHVLKLDGPLDAVGSQSPPRWHGHHAVGAARFVGRVSDMWRVHSALLAGDAAIVTGARGAALAQMTGLGGIGKSLLAQEYALRFAAAYPGGVFWLNAGGTDRRKIGSGAVVGASEQFRAFAIELQLPVAELSPDETQAALARALDAASAPFLWIVDDLDPETDDELALWLAPSHFGSTLVTTRDRRFTAIGSEVPLGVLSANEAVELLRHHRQPAGAAEEDALHGVGRDLGGHALALDVAGSALRAEVGVRSIADFRNALSRPTHDELELASALADELPTGHERSIAATLVRSIHQLSNAGLDFLRLAALLADAPIPPQLVTSALAAADGLSPDEARRGAVAAMHDAANRSLAEISGDHEGSRRVHSLVSRTMRFTDESTSRVAVLRAAAITALTDELGSSSAGSAETTSLLAHARELASSCADEAEAVLLALVARHDFDRGDYAGSLELQRKVVETYKQVLAMDDPRTTSAMSNVAVTLSTLGKLGEAEELEMIVLGGRVRTLGPDHPDTLMTLNSVGETKRAQGDFESAFKLHQQALEGFLRAQDPRVLVSLNNLALTLVELGEFSRAQELQEQAVDGYRQLHGNDAPETLAAASNLAEMRWEAGARDEARALTEQVLARRRETLGEAHPDTLGSMNNLAAMLQERGDLRAARELQEDVFAGYRSVFGDEHRATLTAKGNLAGTLRKLGELSCARALQEEVLATTVSVWGEAHHEVWVSMANLGGTLRDQGEIAAAQDLHRRAFEGLRDALGIDHPTTVAIAEALRATLEAAGDRHALAALDDELVPRDEEHREPTQASSVADPPPPTESQPVVTASSVDTSLLDNAGWCAMLSELAIAERWPELWGFVGIAPPTWTRTILKVLGDAGWDPGGAASEMLRTLDALARRCPMKLSGVRLVEAPPGVGEAHPYPSLGLVMTPDANLLAYGHEDGRISLWSLPDGTLTGTLNGHASSVRSLAVSPDGRLLASGDQNGIVRVWDLASMDVVGVLERDEMGGAIASLTFALDGEALAAGTNAGTVRFWRGMRPTELGTQEGHTSTVSQLVSTPDCLHFVSASLDSVVLWQTDGSYRAALERVTHHGPVPGYTPSIVVCDSTGTIAWGGTDGRIRRAVVGREEVTATAVLAHRDWVLCLAAAPEPAILASGSQDGTITVSRPSGSRTWEVRTLGSPAVSAIAISCDGNTLASAGRDFDVRVWDLTADDTMPEDSADTRSLHKLAVWQEFSGHTAPAHKLTISPDGAVLASTDHHGAVWLWPTGLLQALDLPIAKIALQPLERVAATAPADTRAWIEFITTLTEHRADPS